MMSRRFKKTISYICKSMVYIKKRHSDWIFWSKRKQAKVLNF
jgi:hypothetical protein